LSFETIEEWVEPFMMRNAAKEIYPGVGQENLSIELTTRCNGSCLHCFVRSGISRISSLPVDLVKEIMAEGYDTGYRHLHITGGEPLLWEGLFETLDYGFKVGYETIFMNTNGTLVSEEVSKRLADYSLFFSMSISLDGPEALHDRIRGKGSHRRTIRGIEKALNRGIDLTIFTTVTKSLLPKLPLFVDDLFWRFPGIDYLILIQLIRMTNGSFGLSEELLEPEDFVRLVRMVALLDVGGFRAIVKKNPLTNVVSKMLEMPWIPRVPPLYREGCMIVKANRHIGVVHSSRNSFGRYRPGLIRKVLVSDGYRRAVAPDQTTCPSCRHAQLCKESGMIRPPQGYGDPYVDTPFCRRVLDSVALVKPILGASGEDKRPVLIDKAYTKEGPSVNLRVFDRSVSEEQDASTTVGGRGM
jgi:MoaA/NifB/PqqE/SkfB family radical SAM enzyme